MEKRAFSATSGAERHKRKSKKHALWKESLSRRVQSVESRTRLAYLPLLSAGLLVFLGLVMLGGPTGLLWHVRPYEWWIRLNPSLLGPWADWLIWASSFLLTVSPSVLAGLRVKVKPDPVSGLVILVFPLLSLAAMSWSYYVGATLMLGSGFLAAYVLVSRSETLLSIEVGSAVRIVCAEVFALLAMVASGGLISVLLWHFDAFGAMSSWSSALITEDVWLRMLALDLEVFYLARPVLPATLIIVGAAAIVALFREPLESCTRRILSLLVGRRGFGEHPIPSPPLQEARKETYFLRCFPYVILVASVVLGVAIALYPYAVANFRGVLGSDSWFYLQKLNSMNKLADTVPLLQTDRGLFLLILFLVKTSTGLTSEWVVRVMPAALAAFLAVSSFVFVREGTGRPLLGSLAAVLSVVSPQTALGMSAGIIANWFALSLANLTFAFFVRSVRVRSARAAFGCVGFSLVLLASYAYQSSHLEYLIAAKANTN